MSWLRDLLRGSLLGEVCCECGILRGVTRKGLWSGHHPNGNFDIWRRDSVLAGDSASTLEWLNTKNKNGEGEKLILIVITVSYSSFRHSPQCVLLHLLNF